MKFYHVAWWALTPKQNRHSAKGRQTIVALMQVSGEDRCWLFRVNRLGVDGAVKRFLENDAILKVGIVY